MDVLYEIKKFENHPDRQRFSELQVNDFWKTVAGLPVNFEGIVSSVKRCSDGLYEIIAETYAYSVQHNPVAGNDYVEWKVDQQLYCKAEEGRLKFDPMEELAKGARIHCRSSFETKDEAGIHVLVHSIERVPFLESEKEMQLLQKKFNKDQRERTTVAPRRNFQKRMISAVFTYAVLGMLIGALLGMFWGVLTGFFSEDAELISSGMFGALIGAVLFSVYAFVAFALRQAAKN